MQRGGTVKSVAQRIAYFATIYMRRFTLNLRPPYTSYNGLGTHLFGGFAEPQTVVDTVGKKRKSLTCARNAPRLFDTSGHTVETEHTTQQ